MSTHNICFLKELRKIFDCWYPLFIRSKFDWERYANRQNDCCVFNQFWVVTAALLSGAMNRQAYCTQITWPSRNRKSCDKNVCLRYSKKLVLIHLPFVYIYHIILIIWLAQDPIWLDRVEQKKWKTENGARNMYIILLWYYFRFTMKALRCPFLTRVSMNQISQNAKSLLANHVGSCPVMGRVISSAQVATLDIEGMGKYMCKIC